MWPPRATAAHGSAASAVLASLPRRCRRRSRRLPSARPPTPPMPPLWPPGGRRRRHKLTRESGHIMTAVARNPGTEVDRASAIAQPHQGGSGRLKGQTWAAGVGTTGGVICVSTRPGSGLRGPSARRSPMLPPHAAAGGDTSAIDRATARPRWPSCMAGATHTSWMVGSCK
jgi:hypothetical protein